MVKNHQPSWDEKIIYDPNHLADFTAGDQELIHEVLVTFKRNAPNYLLELAKAEGDWRQKAHKLKGAARAIGAWNLAVEAERAERANEPVTGSPARKARVAELAKRLELLISHLIQKKLI